MCERYGMARALHGTDMLANFVKFEAVGSVWGLNSKLTVLVASDDLQLLHVLQSWKKARHKKTGRASCKTQG